MLWWLGAITMMATVVGLYASNWHWYIPVLQAESFLVAPERSGFRSPYPHCEIAANGISPNGEFAFILAFYFGDDWSVHPNCLVMRSRPGQRVDLPTEIDSSSVKRGGLNGVVRWAKDSSAVICFKNMDHPIEGGPVEERSAYDIYVVPIISGQPREPTALETEILKVSHPDFAKALEGKMKFAPCSYSRITDQGLEDDMTFNDSNLLVIDCYCSNCTRASDNDLSFEGYVAHVTGLWDPIQAKFIKVSYERGARTHY
jgi:hypothetical protein